ncbi:hypothetical protein PAMA_018934 [Pampus argenteus]
MVPAWTCKINRCLTEDKVESEAARLLKRYNLQPTVTSSVPTPDSAASCPLELYQHMKPNEALNNRSLSPWRYVRVNKKDHYPESYVEARCLCTGCIIFQGNKLVESDNYNSVPVLQSKTFFKKKLCPNKKTYSLKAVSVDVAVGCTCAIANTSYA